MRALTAGWLTLFAAAAAAQAPPSPLSPPVIVTTGHAVVHRAPDVAVVSVAVESRARSPRAAQQQNAQTASAVVSRLVELGIPRSALRTMGLDLQQEFDTTGGRRTPSGFLARNTIQVTVDDVARAGEIVDAAVQAGATSLGGVRFDLKDRAAAEREAVRLAVVDARGRADAAAAGAGRAIDRILKIEEGGSVAPAPRPFATMRAAEAVTPVEPGEVEIRAEVTLTVSMK